MPRDVYYDANDFLAREYPVDVEIECGAIGLASELSIEASARVNERDVPKGALTSVPLWWLDGGLWRDILITSCPPELEEATVHELEAPGGGLTTDLRGKNASFFGFARAYLDALSRQEREGEEEEEEPDDVKNIRARVQRAFARRWSECLCEALGRSDAADAIERSLTREERVIWNVARDAQRSYDAWRYGRGERVVASKMVIDAKRRRT